MRDEAAAQIARALREDEVEGGRGRVILFAMTRVACQDLASMLLSKGIASGIDHGQLPASQRLDTLRKWKEGQAFKVVVATSGFGAGVDYPHVRLVVHFGGSHSLLDYAQESGRAGRDGARACCLVITSSSFERTVEHFQDRSFWRWAHHEGCWRQALEAYLVGSPQPPCTANPAVTPCHHCSSMENGSDHRFRWLETIGFS
jgi:ATP-dependent DNA helicase RecQ